MHVHWSTVALERVGEVADGFSNATAAERWIVGVFAAAERLDAFPDSGRVVPELNRPDVREVFYEQHRILYRVGAARVEVLTVRHMRQRLGGVDEP